MRLKWMKIRNFVLKIIVHLSWTLFNHFKDDIIHYIKQRDAYYEKALKSFKESVSISEKNYSVFTNNLQSNLKLEEQFFFNNYSHGENDWDMMDEPVSNKFDRYAHTMIKFKEIEREKNFKYNKNAEVLEEVDEESEKNSVNHINNDKNEITQIKISLN